MLMNGGSEFPCEFPKLRFSFRGKLLTTKSPDFGTKLFNSSFG
jgi:hypothetical protein